MSRCSYSSVVVVCLLHTVCHWTPTGQNIDTRVNIDIDRTSRTKPPTELLIQALFPVVMASYVSHRKSYNDTKSVGSTPHPQWLNYIDNISRVSPCHAFDLAYPGDRSRLSVDYRNFCLGDFSTQSLVYRSRLSNHLLGQINGTHYCPPEYGENFTCMFSPWLLSATQTNIFGVYQTQFNLLHGEPTTHFELDQSFITALSIRIPHRDTYSTMTKCPQ